MKEGNSHRIRKWIDSLGRLPTSEEMKKFAFVMSINPVHVRNVANDYGLLIEVKNKKEYVHSFEKDIQHFTYDIEEEIKNIDVDKLYKTYKKRKL